MRFSLLGLLVIVFILNSKAQDVLSIEEAVAIALENNYGVKIADLENLATEMQVYRSNAGFGPIVDWNAGLGLSGSRVNQQFLDGRVNNRWGRAFNPNTNIAARMTVFDGGRMQTIYDQLVLNAQLSKLEAKIIVQNVIEEVISAYYEIARQKATLEYLDNIITSYEERLKITEQRWKVGRGSKLDFLQSNTELNTQLSEKVRVTNNLKNAKVALNGILNRDLNTEYDIDKDDSIPMTSNLDGLLMTTKQKNRDIILLDKTLELSKKREEEWETTMKPQVDLTGSLGYNYSNTNAGFLTSNQSFSLPLNVSARWTLYDGKHRKNQLAIAKVNSSIIEEQQKELEQGLETALTLAYNQYQSDKELLDLEKQNNDIAKENLDIALEKFRLGGSSILELNEAQRAYNVSLNRFVNAQYSIRFSELQLLLLSGQLTE